MAEAKLSKLAVSDGAKVPMKVPYSMALMAVLQMGQTPWWSWHSRAHSAHSAECSHGFRRVARGSSMHTTQRPASEQRLTLVHFSFQRQRFLSDRGCIYGLLRGCLRVITGFSGVLRVLFVSETAQGELKSGQM